MDIKEIRYLFEHRLLPQWLYREKETLISVLLQKDKNMAFQIFSDICKKENVEMPYKEEQYRIIPYGLSDKAAAVCLQLPSAEVSPQCERVYFVFDQEKEKFAFYSVEKGAFDYNVLCGWSEDGGHLNYGKCPEDENEELKRLLDLFEHN